MPVKSNRHRRDAELLSKTVFPPLSDTDKAALRATADRVLTGPDGEPIPTRIHFAIAPNVMSFGEQVVEALGEFVDAKLDYARARRAVGGEYANGDDVNKTATRLQELLDNVRLAL